MSRKIIPTAIFICCATMFPQSVTTTPSQNQCKAYGYLATVSNNDVPEQNELEMHCSAKASCDGITCNGKYTYRGFYSLNELYEVDFCFGLRIHHCSQPEKMDINLTVPDHNVIYSTRQNLEDFDEPVTGLALSFELTGRMRVTAQGFLDVDTKDLGQNKVSVKVVMKTRISLPFNQQTWPSALQRVVVPNTTITLDGCSGSPETLHQTHNSWSVPQCQNLIKGVKPPTTTPGTKCSGTNVGKKSTTYGKDCDLHDFNSCGEGEVCLPRTKKCACVDGATYCSNFQSCEIVDINMPTAITKPTTTHNNPTQGHKNGVTTAASPSTKKSGNTKTIIIAVSAVVGALVLVGIGVGGYVWYRKRRAPYEGREMILTAETM